MIDIILGYFGYVKIPVEAVRLSIANESIFELMIEASRMEKIKDKLKQALEGQKTITQFLRSCRKI